MSYESLANASGAVPVILVFVFPAIALLSIAVIKTLEHIQNAMSPVRQVHARVLYKRTKMDKDNGMESPEKNNPTTTQYFVTFELDNGEKIELKTNSRKYFMLVEGYSGTLKHQLGWYKEFIRDPKI